MCVDGQVAAVSLLRHISRANISSANWRVSLTVDVAQLARPGPTDVGGRGHHRTGAHAASAAAATVHDVVSPLAFEQHRAFHKVVRQDRYRLSRRAVPRNIVLLVSPKQRRERGREREGERDRERQRERERAAISAGCART